MNEKRWSDSGDRLKAWEIALLLAAVLVFATSAYLYVNDISIQEFIHGRASGSGLEKVAILESSVGESKRQLPTSSVFVPIDRKSSVYNGDTLVTGRGSKVLIRFEDGSSIEMSENTMMKIAFEREFSLGGISRVPSVQVLSGNVIGKSKSPRLIIRTPEKEMNLAQGQAQKVSIAPPVAISSPEPPELREEPLPSPSPAELPPEIRKIEVRLLYPEHRSRVEVAEGSPLPEAKTALEWMSDVPSEPLELIVGRMGVKGQFEAKFRRTIVPNEEGRSVFPIRLRAPGTYRWAVRSPEEAKKSGKFVVDPIPRSDFEIPRDFIGIDIDSVQLNTRSDPPKMTIQWQPYDQAVEYRVLVTKDGQSLVDEDTRETSFEFAPGEVLGRRFSYQVYADHPTGFRVFSPKKEFYATLQKPILRNPDNGAKVSAEISRRDRKKKPKTLFFTWGRVPLGRKYLFEISRDPKFSRISAKRDTQDNFYAIKMLPPGKYYWRVTAFSEQAEGEKSEVFGLIVTE